MLKFENNEEICVKGITTFGTSVKKEGSIGFFGTGLKYAIAIILRNGGKITIFSGDKRYNFSTKKTKVRNKEFEIITMNDRELSFTTDLGKTWELWQAYRELFCNTKDEGGTVEFIDKPVRGKVGATRIIVDGLDNIHNANSEFILNTEPLYTLSEVELHEITDESGAIFYKGIRVYKPNEAMNYNYNILTDIDLTEDRTAKYIWSVKRIIANSIISCHEAEPVRKIISSEGGFESNIDFGECYIAPSECFLSVVSKIKSNEVNRSAMKVYEESLLNEIGEAKTCNLKKEDENIILKAIKIAEKMGYLPIYNIAVSDVLKDSLSQVNNETIILSDKLLKSEMSTIVEHIYDNFMLIRYKEPHLARQAVIKEFIRKVNKKSLKDLILKRNRG